MGEEKTMAEIEEKKEADKSEELRTEETEEIKTEEIRAEETKTEEIKAEEIKAEEIKTAEIKTEETKTEETKPQPRVETIGKVTLDLSRYPGEDLYCDGASEDELLAIARDLSPVEYAKAIEEKASWPILYHLSPQRENIVEWLPIKKTDKVLEVGSGCGAITGVLSRKAGSVTCVELSKKRSLINAHRHRECDNVCIHVGNFQDIEKDLPKDYDYIFLIGVFEYGRSYIGGEDPYAQFLRILRPHLNEKGRIVIAIENKYGMKYFSGCKEDHLGTYFGGIENYESGKARTFGRKRLEQIFRACDLGQYHFYYPYPDYKFMTTLYSDEHLPGKGELSNNLRNFDADRMLLFSEKAAFDGAIEDGVFDVFANSYLVVIGDEFETDYVKYSNDRAPEYAIRTQIVRKEEGKCAVRKYPLDQAAYDHVRGMALAYTNLTERYRGGELKINQCELVEREDGLYAEFEFLEGVPLAQLLDQCLKEGDREGFYRYFRKYVERIGYNASFEVTDFDPVFSNILVSGDTWTLIDYEWTFGKSIDTKELAFRAIYCYLLEDERRGELDFDGVLQELGITQEDAEQYRDQEREFQKFVTGKRLSMGEIRNLTGGEILEPTKWIHKFKTSEAVLRVQIYEDLGQGFSEQRSRFLPEAYLDEQQVEFAIPVGGNVRQLRVDPALCPCVCKILEMTLDGREVPLTNRKAVETNGRLLKADAKSKNCPSIVFATQDPNICLKLEELQREVGSELTVRMQVVRLPMEIAQDMAAAAKKII